MFAEAWPIDVQTLLWRTTASPGLHAIPSSPLYPDVNAAMRSMWSGDVRRWTLRLWRLVEALVAQRETLTDIIFDLAPGLGGLALEVFHLIGCMQTRTPLAYDLSEEDGTITPSAERAIFELPVRFVGRRFIVMSPDRQDIAQAIDGFARLGMARSAQVHLIANRASEGLDSLMARGREIFGNRYDGWGLFDRIGRVGELPVLAGLFKTRTLAELVPDDESHLSRALRIGGDG